MKKTFPLTNPKKKPERQLEAVKSELTKYLKRERRKQLPEGVDFWDFDCKCGLSPETAEPSHVAELPKRIEALQAAGSAECYLEVLAKEGRRQGGSSKDNADLSDEDSGPAPNGSVSQ